MSSVAVFNSLVERATEKEWGSIGGGFNAMCFLDGEMSSCKLCPKRELGGGDCGFSENQVEGVGSKTVS